MVTILHRVNSHSLLEYNNEWPAICLTPQKIFRPSMINTLSADFQGPLFTT